MSPGLLICLRNLTIIIEALQQGHLKTGLFRGVSSSIMTFKMSWTRDSSFLANYHEESRSPSLAETLLAAHVEQ